MSDGEGRHRMRTIRRISHRPTSERHSANCANGFTFAAPTAVLPTPTSVRRPTRRGRWGSPRAHNSQNSAPPNRRGHFADCANGFHGSHCPADCLPNLAGRVVNAATGAALRTGHDVACLGTADVPSSAVSASALAIRRSNETDPPLASLPAGPGPILPIAGFAVELAIATRQAVPAVPPAT